MPARMLRKTITGKAVIHEEITRVCARQTPVHERQEIALMAESLLVFLKSKGFTYRQGIDCLGYAKWRLIEEFREE